MTQARILLLSLLLPLLLWPGACTEAGAAGQDQQPAPEALIVPVQGTIGIGTVALVSRALRECSERGIVRLILDVDTPGGEVVSMREVENLLSVLRADGVQVTAWVQRHALSAGAYITFACDQTFMAPGATLGAMTPVLGGVAGVAQLPPDARAKAISAITKDAVALLERRGDTRPEVTRIAEAMIDPDKELWEVGIVGGGGVEETVVVDRAGLAQLERDGREIRFRESLGPAPLTLTAEQALRHGFSSGTYGQFEDLLREELGVRPDTVERLQATWSEEGAAWLNAMKPLLFLFGFLLLLVEMKTPGFAVPGILGVLLLAAALFGSYLVGLAEVTEILIFFLGLAAIAVEIFVLPGTLVFGALGLLCMVSSLILSQQTFLWPETPAQNDILFGNLLDLLLLIVLTGAFSAVFWRFLPHIPILRRALLNRPLPAAATGSAYSEREIEAVRDLVGDVGRAATPLRPAGIAEIDGERLDVVTEGAFLEAGTPVRVVSHRGNRVVVAAVDGDADREGGEVGIELLILLFFVGLLLLLAEVFFVSFGVLSILSAGALVSAVFLAFLHHGQGVGFTFLLGTVVGGAATVYFGLKWLPHTGIGRKMFLSAPKREEVSHAAQDPGLEAWLGKKGVATSDLRPSGYARIDGQRVDVVTRGELLDEGTPIEVVRVDSNRVVVARDGAAARSSEA